MSRTDPRPNYGTGRPGALFCQCGAEPRDEQPSESEAQP